MTMIVIAQKGTIGIQNNCTIMLAAATKIANQMPNSPPLMTLNAAMMPRTPMMRANQPHVVRLLTT